jgi:hypothetical protein
VIQILPSASGCDRRHTTVSSDLNTYLACCGFVRWHSEGRDVHGKVPKLRLRWTRSKTSASWSAALGDGQGMAATSAWARHREVCMVGLGLCLLSCGGRTPLGNVGGTSGATGNTNNPYWTAPADDGSCPPGIALCGLGSISAVFQTSLRDRPSAALC